MATDKQRRAAQRRRAQRQAQRRAERARRRRRINLIVSVVGTLAVAGLVVAIIAATSGSGGSPKKQPTQPVDPNISTAPRATLAPTTTTPAPVSSSAGASRATSTAAAAPRATSSRATQTAATRSVACRYLPSGRAARPAHAPGTRAPASGTATVALTTSRGPMTFRLDRRTAPCAVNSFVSLVRQGYYAHTSCHRLVTRTIYVLQCGDPTGTGRGGPGYTFPNEGVPAARNARGALVMTNGRPDRNGGQFFIVWRTSALGAFTTFGRVTSGMASLNPVAAAGTTNGSADGRPKLPVTFDSLTVT